MFDNAAELPQVAEPLPRGITHGVIITSRSRLGIIEGVETVKLESVVHRPAGMRADAEHCAYGDDHRRNAT
ncbi:hypothetical protein [Streptomyces sp. NPDC048650]|uniref:hypothetical protein n=1 Tax=unclassified Streptomyces TaxID=2593676 RepID=UPI00370F825D